MTTAMNLNVQSIAGELEAFRRRLSTVQDDAELEALRQAYFGKSGRLRALSQALRDVAPDARPAVASVFNETKNAIEHELARAFEGMRRESLRRSLDAEWLDISLPACGNPRGSRHPIAIV